MLYIQFCRSQKKVGMIRNKHLIQLKQDTSQASPSRWTTLRREAKDFQKGVEPIIAVPPTKSFDQVGTAPKIDTLQ